jgi:hypothetical protein
MAQTPDEPVLVVVFYRTEAGNEPVREWLKKPSRELNTARRRLADLQKE